MTHALIIVILVMILKTKSSFFLLLFYAKIQFKKTLNTISQRPKFV